MTKKSKELSDSQKLHLQRLKLDTKLQVSLIVPDTSDRTMRRLNSVMGHEALKGVFLEGATDFNKIKADLVSRGYEGKDLLENIRTHIDLYAHHPAVRDGLSKVFGEQAEPFIKAKEACLEANGTLEKYSKLVPKSLS